LPAFLRYSARDVRRFFCSATAVQEDEDETWMYETE
jgi:hypothetical protein